MSGQPLNKPSDAGKFRTAYLNTLAAQARIDAKNLSANQIYKTSGQPSALPDTRTTTEKLADFERLRVENYKNLQKITDGEQALAIVSQLSDNELQYLAQKMPSIIDDARKNNAIGIIADTFLPLFRNMMMDDVGSASSMGAENVGDWSEGSSGERGIPVYPSNRSESDISSIDVGLPDFGEPYEDVPMSYAEVVRPLTKLEIGAMTRAQLVAALDRLSEDDWAKIEATVGSDNVFNFANRTIKSTAKVSQIREIMGIPFRVSLAESERGGKDFGGSSRSESNSASSFFGEGIKGRGLKTKKPKSDGKVCIEKQPTWTGIGDKLINTSKLQNNILSMRHTSGRSVEGLPTQHLSQNLAKVLRKIVGGELPSYDDVEILNDEEKEKLAKIGNRAKINSKINIPRKTKEQQEMLEFEILRGQVLAGNDNKGLLKRFKMMLVKFGDDGKLPLREVRDVLMTLAAQGL